MLDKLRKLASEPLVHFLLIGAAIYVAFGLVNNEEVADERRIYVSSNEIQALTDQWTRMWNRPPTEEELQGVVRDHVRTQILFQEAVAMGLDDGDVVIERRLAQKLEMLATSLITPAEPTDEELLEWYAANPDVFKQPDLYSLAHVFFDPDKPDSASLEDVAAVRDTLNALDEVPEDFSSYGDRFMLQSYYPRANELELRRGFGSGFVAQIVDLEPGIWHGPILSGYGPHVVMLIEVQRIPPPPFEVVREQIKEQWTVEQVEELSEKFIHELVKRYEVDVEETDVALTVPGKGAAP